MITNRNQIKIAQALLSLYPGAQWTCYGDHYDDLVWHEWNEFPKPNKKTILDEVERLKEEFDRNQYQRDRKKFYPSIEEQLDILYHQGYDAWKEEISKIKNQYPKPE